MTENPYKLSGGNPAGSLAQSIANIGNLFADRASRKAKLSEKMMDSEIRMREKAVDRMVAGQEERKNIKTQGKVEKKQYKSQAKTNVKAAERLVGAKKGEGAVKGGTKVSLGRERLDMTAKESAPAAKPSKASATKAPRQTPAAKTPAAKTPAKAAAAKPAPAPTTKAAPTAKPPTARKAK